MALQLAAALNEKTLPVVLTQTPSDRIMLDYWPKADFAAFSLRNIWRYASQGALFLSHSRKTTTQLMCLKKMMGRRLRVVHVAHNTFTDKKRQSLFPDTIIAVSHGVKENLVSYFGVPEERVHVIYNGVDDAYDPQTAVSRMRDGIIRVLLPGRVCPVKQQLKIVEACMGRLSAHVHIDFAGEGEDLPRLRQLTSGSRQFHCLGLVDLKNYLPHYDYVMLFSQKEGLGLSLIEGGYFANLRLQTIFLCCVRSMKTRLRALCLPTLVRWWKGLIIYPIRIVRNIVGLQPMPALNMSVCLPLTE